MATRAAEPKTRSILVELRDGRQMIVGNIPSNAKITLGPVSMSKSDYENRDIALRVYTTLGNQLAVFRNVTSFRDLSLEVQIEEIIISEESSVQEGPRGGYHNRSHAINREFVQQAVPVLPAHR